MLDHDQSSYNVLRCNRHFMYLCELADQCSPLTPAEKSVKVTFRMLGICNKIDLKLIVAFFGNYRIRTNRGTDDLRENQATEHGGFARVFESVF